jgi:RNA polymerase sigma-70 factor (ECF subfamily)
MTDSDSAAKPATDEQLMLEHSRGSSEAFTALFTRYKQPLFGFFRRRLADTTAAEELTQETFLAILRVGSRYQPSALFRTYLYAIAFNHLRAHRRKTAFRSTFFDTSHQNEPSCESTLIPELLLRDAVRKLAPIEREILMLREFEQLSYGEIAELLNLPLNTVRSRLFRARTGLREILTARSPQSSRQEELS